LLFPSSVRTPGSTPTSPALHARQGYLSIHLLVETPQSHADRLDHAAGFYDDINERGLVLV